MTPFCVVFGISCTISDQSVVRRFVIRNALMGLDRYVAMSFLASLWPTLYSSIFVNLQTKLIRNYNKRSKNKRLNLQLGGHFLLLLCDTFQALNVGRLYVQYCFHFSNGRKQLTENHFCGRQNTENDYCKHVASNHLYGTKAICKLNTYEIAN